MTEETTTPREADSPVANAAQPSPPAATDAQPSTAAETPAGSEIPTPAQAPTSAAEDGLRARIGDLERQVAELERQVATERDAASDYMRRYQQAQADFANFRRRTRQEQEQAQRLFGLEATARILPALDSLERAFATLPPSLRRLTWIDGVALIHMQLQQGLASLGIEAVSAEPGQPFDPRQHEAIGEVETAEHPEGHIAVVVQRGYATGETLLRPALVQVARAPQASVAPTPEHDTDATDQSGPASEPSDPSEPRESANFQATTPTNEANETDETNNASETNDQTDQ